MTFRTLSSLVAATVVATLWSCTKPPPPEQEVPVAASVAAFTASKSRVAPGEAVTLSWEVKDATSVSVATLSGEPVTLSNPSAQKGSVEVTVDSTTVYMLTARGEGGSASAATSVAIADRLEDLLFTAIPQEIAAGEPVTLVWNAPGSTDVEITDAQGTAVYSGSETSASRLVHPNAGTTYTLTAGERTQTVSITVAPRIAGFQSTEPSAQPGGKVTLSWNAVGATQVTLEAEGRGTLATITDPAKIADGSHEDTVPAQLPERNGLIRYTLTASNDVATVVQHATVYVGVNPLVQNFFVPAFGKEGGSTGLSWSVLEANHLEIAVDGQVVYVAPTQAAIANGQILINTPAADAMVSLTATNARGGKTTVDRPLSPVGEPTLVDFSPDTATLQNGGEPVTLSWNVPNARHVRISVKGGRTLFETTSATAETGSVVAYPNDLTEYELHADNAVGDVLAPATVSVAVTTPGKLVFSPASAPIGAQVTVTSHTVTNGGNVLGLPTTAHNAPGASFVDISQIGTSIAYSGPDTTAKLVALPEVFNTRIHGQPVASSTLSISINGWFAFQSSSFSGPDTPTPFPNSALVPLAIAPFWDDLRDTDEGEIFVHLDTDGGERRLIVQWNQVEYDPNDGSVVTLQAQVYEGGKIVFAYKTLQDISGATPSIGVVNADESTALAVTTVPAEGDTFTFFGEASLPVSFTLANADPISVQVRMPGDARLDLTAQSPAIPPGLFFVSEANISPAAALTDAQWFEIQNTTPDPIDLDGWTIEFGGSQHQISGPAVIPPSGFLVLAQSAAAADGVNVGYVYGPTHVIPSSDAEVGLSLQNALYTTSRFGSGVPKAGYAIQAGPPAAGMEVRADVTLLGCSAASSSTYGTNGQYGTPGAANTPCPSYVNSGLIAGAFESLAGGVGTALPGGDQVVDEVTLPAPVWFGGIAYNKVYMNSNGFVTLEPHTCPSSFNCYYSNKSTIDSVGLPVGAIAPFWDDLVNNSSNSSRYWARIVPGLAPNDGYTVFSWENWKSWYTTSSLNFQVKFFDNGNIEFHYGTMTSSSTGYALGSSATTWLEVPEGGAAFKVNINSSTAPGIAPNTGYRFTAQ